MEGKRRPKKGADKSRLVGNIYNKQGNLHLTLALDSCKMSRSLPPATRILKVYIEALPGFSHVFSPDDLNNTFFSQSFILENSSFFEMVGRITF